MTELFKEGLEEAHKRIDRLVEHFRHADYLVRQKLLVQAVERRGGARRLNAEEQRLADLAREKKELLMTLFAEAVLVERSLPDGERSLLRGGNNFWRRVVLTDADAWFAQNARKSDLRFRGTHLAFSSEYDEPVKPRARSADAVQRCWDVLDLLRFIQSEGAVQLKSLVWNRASGMPVDECARKLNPNHVYDGPRHRRYVVNEAINRALSEIFKGMESEFHLRFTARGLERLAEREIDRRAKVRKRIEREGA